MSGLYDDLEFNENNNDISDEFEKERDNSQMNIDSSLKNNDNDSLNKNNDVVVHDNKMVIENDTNTSNNINHDKITTAETSNKPIYENIKLPPKLLHAKKKVVTKSSSSSSNNNSNNAIKISPTFQTEQSNYNNNNTNNSSHYYDDDEEILDEYNPFEPNDYEQCVKERYRLEQERFKRDTEIQNANINEMDIPSRKRPLSPPMQSSSSSSTSTPTQTSNSLFNLDETGEAAYQRRMKLSKTDSNNDHQQHQQQPTSLLKKKPLSEKHQFSPLPTKILMLSNITSKNEIDEFLQEEIQKECEKYGTVNKVVIHIVQPQDSSNNNNNNVNSSTDGEVRVFVYFNSSESSQNAFLQLNDRYFAKRKVLANYYKENLFFKNKLDPWSI